MILMSIKIKIKALGNQGYWEKFLEKIERITVKTPFTASVEPQK